MRVELLGTEDPHGRPPGPLGLALCGGGITGGLFEIGVLSAIDDVLGRRVEDEIQAFVAASAGASVAATLAWGVSVERLYRAMESPDDPFFPLTRRVLVPIEPGHLLRSASGLAGGLVRGFARWLSHPWGVSLVDELYTGLIDSMPGGIFRMERYRDFFEDFVARNGFPERFDGLSRTLLVPANDVDSGSRVVFGAGDLTDVPIPLAIAASSAIPIMYEPVRHRGRDHFDGGIGRVAHADLLVERGYRRILVINPVVPIHYDRAWSGAGRARLADKGFLWVYNQCYRIMNQVRLHLALDALVARHPGVQVLLIEPDASETVMFLHESMATEGRDVVLDYARTHAAAALREADGAVRRFLDGEAAPRRVLGVVG